MSVIINTSVFSNFATVKRLDLLRLVFGQLYLSEQVFEEIQTGLLQGYTFYTMFKFLVRRAKSYESATVSLERNKDYCERDICVNLRFRRMPRTL